MIEPSLLDEIIDKGFVKKNKHPEADIYILNYTPKTQYEGFWNETTMNCRGLIVDNNYEILSRCFKKFFNYGEVKEQVDGFLSKSIKYSVYEKIDGSLGISYFLKDKPFIATRGSFASEQAIKANQMLKNKNIKLDRDLTYLFEIVYPENTIVVNYGKKEDLVLLSVIETSTGKEIDIYENSFGFTTCNKINCNSLFDLDTNLNNFEGYVVRFDNGYRFKIKLDEYVRLHKLLFGLSSRDIWSCLKSGSDLELEGVPDEIFSWIKSIKSSIISEYKKIEENCQTIFSNIVCEDRKDFALKATKTDFSAILFKMYDKKPYCSFIWEKVKPDYFTYKGSFEE
jgi:T4 RnlA family RNA ligase